MLSIAWICIAVLLALWSLLVWIGHALAGLALSGAAHLGATTPGDLALRLPDWLASWLPAALMSQLESLLVTAVPLIHGALIHLPSSTGWLTAFSWLLWGLGAFMLLALGAASHALRAVWQRGRSLNPG